MVNMATVVLETAHLLLVPLLAVGVAEPVLDVLLALLLLLLLEGAVDDSRTHPIPPAT